MPGPSLLREDPGERENGVPEKETLFRFLLLHRALPFTIGYERTGKEKR